MSGGGKGSKQVVIGYRYYMSVVLALCHGPVDAVTELFFGERSAWKGRLTGGDLHLNAENLFGGEEREGGVKGLITLLPGDEYQSKHPYLIQNRGGAVPAYRGVATLIFGRPFMWSVINPRFQKPWQRVERYFKGWTTPVFEPTLLRIGDVDMNPAHIIYETLTNNAWGMGYKTNDIDADNFKNVAQTLKNEEFGISILWSESIKIKDFIQIILDHINGVLAIDAATSKFKLLLIRNDYDVNSIMTFDDDSIVNVTSYQRQGWGDVINTVIVNYKNRNEDTESVTVQSLAAIQSQGGRVIALTKEYFGIHNPILARRVCERDLLIASTPLAKVSFTVNRKAWNLEIGDVFKMTYSKLGIETLVCRVIGIQKGELTDGTITIDAIQDIFGMPSNSYVGLPGTGWSDPFNPPRPSPYTKLMEAGYWDIVRMVGDSYIHNIPPETYYIKTLVGRATSDVMTTKMLTSPTPIVANFAETGSVTSTPYGKLQKAISKTDTVLQLVDVMDFTDDANFDKYDYFYIDNECVGFVSINYSTYELTVTRGVLDTIPENHDIGSFIILGTLTGRYDSTERALSEKTYYKFLSITSKGTLPINSAPTKDYTIFGRFDKPYPPANVRFNTQYYPTDALLLPVTISWSHRDRLTQSVTLVPYTTGNIGPESGVTYTIQIKNSSGTVLETKSGLTTPEYKLTTIGTNLQIVIWSVRGTLTSWQTFNHTITTLGKIGIPSTLPKLVGWWIADDDMNTYVNGELKLLKDLSMSGADGVPDQAYNAPLVHYQGRQYWISTPTKPIGFYGPGSSKISNNTSELTIFAVVKISTPTINNPHNYNYLFRTTTPSDYDRIAVYITKDIPNVIRTHLRRLDSDPAGNYSPINNVPNDQYVILGVQISFIDRTTTYFINSEKHVIPHSSGTSGLTSNTNPKQVSIGCGGSSAKYDWQGQIGEMVVTHSILTDNDRYKVEGYLAWEWNHVNLLPDDHPYKHAAPTMP